MRRGSMVALLAIGCGSDPSLTVEVTHPTGSGVDHTAVTIYESATARCTDIEFNQLDAAQLEALQVAELVIDASGARIEGGLDGISRTAPKLVVARGFSAENELLTAGCTEHLEIVEADVAEVTTFSVAEVSVGAITPSGNTIVDITLTSPTGLSLEGRRVGWRVFGPVGTDPAITENVALVDDETWEPAQAACANADNRVRVTPVPPQQLGGFAFEVRASWAVEPPQLFSSFTRVGMGLKAFTPPAPTLRRWCAVHTAAGANELICLDGSEAVEHQLSVTGGLVVFASEQRESVTAGVVAIVDVGRASGVRDVYAVGQKGRVEGLTALAPPSMPINVVPFLPVGEDVVDALGVPACGDQAPKLVLVVRAQPTGVMRIVAFDMDTGTNLGDLGVRPGPSLELNSAGCITELSLDPTEQPIVRQAFVVDTGRGQQATSTAHFDCEITGGRCLTLLPVPRFGVTFTTGDEPRMVSAFFDASGVVLVSWVLLPDGNRERRLVQRERTAAAAFPQLLAAGIVDEDAQLDFAWSLLGAAGDATSFQVAYARPVNNGRLTALSAAQDVLANNLQVADVTNDGRADLIVTGVDQLTSQLGVAVIPSHVPISPGTLMADTPCEAN
jgi:hypothetical protein